MEICGYTKLWKEDISQYDPELAQGFRQLLIHIFKYEFQPWPRCIQPADTRVIAIHQAGDASISAASYTLHVVSVDNQNGQLISRLATAGSYLLHFTIPVNELQSISRGLK